MKTILFCNLPYAFSILKPIAEVLQKREDSYIWYIPKSILSKFPYSLEQKTSEMSDLEKYKADAIFAPGNDVPYWLRGVKIQIFHGLAGEKKGHFRIRDYFDLYLTQGPYFTNKFKVLAKQHKNFEVKETGWCKLDKLYNTTSATKDKKKQLLLKYKTKHIILYSPTFSPSLTSVESLQNTIEQLANHQDILMLIKFHDKMDSLWIEKYKRMIAKNILILETDDITQSLQMADLMISDSSSVVYEFTLLDKPVITYKSTSENIDWCNLTDLDTFYNTTINILQGHDNFRDKRKDTIAQYHPYNDGQSANRMIDAAETYISNNSIPNKRKVSLFRKIKSKQQYK